MVRRVFLVAALLAGLAVRLWHYEAVLTPAGAFPEGTDPYYHLRRARLVLDRGFPPPSRDPFCQFPGGVVDPWPPLFAGALAALGWLTGARSELEIARAAVWFPPLLGLAGILLLYALGRRLVGPRAALAAAWLYALLPGAALRTRLGAVDHHGAELLFALGGALLLARRPRRRWWVGFGVLLAAALLTWLGAVLFALEGAAFLWLRSARQRRGPARQGGAALLLAALLVAPFALTTLPGRGGELRAYHLSLFQPLLFSVLGLALLCRGWLPGRWQPAAWLLLAAGLLVLARPLLEGAGFARRPVPPLLLPFESRPGWSAFGLPRLGLLFVSLPVLALLGGWLRWRSSRGGKVLLFYLLLLHLALAALQLRFAPFAAAELSLLGGVGAAAFVQVLGGVAGGLALLLGFAVPALWSWEATCRPLPPPPEVRAVLTALRRRSPPVTERRPSYSVCAHWDLGHWVNVFARRPVLDSPFLHLTPFRPTAAFFMAPDEATANRLAERYRIRYAVTLPMPARGPVPALYPRQFAAVLGLPEERFLRLRPEGLEVTRAFTNTFYFRLHYLDGAAPRRPPPAAPGLDPDLLPREPVRTWRLHLVADNPELPGERNRVRVFERVPGARLVGTLVPGAVVRLAAWIRTPVHRFRYEDTTRADRDGVFRFQVPHGTGGDDPVQVVGGYELRASVPGWRRQVVVPLRAVRLGQEVRLP